MAKSKRQQEQVGGLLRTRGELRKRKHNDGGRWRVEIEHKRRDARKRAMR